MRQLGKPLSNITTIFFSMEAVRDMQNRLQAMESRVTPKMNMELLRDFTVEEISTTLNQMSPLKALGPDGFSVSFFQKHWATVGNEVSKAVLDLLNSGSMNKDLNSTYIVLIPKVKNPTCVTEFRPISLCNVLYKIISKVLANEGSFT